MKSRESYLNLMETHNQDEKVNLFEKIIAVAKRARSLYSLEPSALARLKHKPTYQAILESNQGRLILKRVQPKDLEEE